MVTEVTGGSLDWGDEWIELCRPCEQKLEVLHGDDSGLNRYFDLMCPDEDVDGSLRREFRTWLNTGKLTR